MQQQRFSSPLVTYLYGLLDLLHQVHTLLALGGTKLDAALQGCSRSHHPPCIAVSCAAPSDPSRPPVCAGQVSVSRQQGCRGQGLLPTLLNSGGSLEPLLQLGQARKSPHSSTVLGRVAAMDWAVHPAAVQSFNGYQPGCRAGSVQSPVLSRAWPRARTPHPAAGRSAGLPPRSTFAPAAPPRSSARCQQGGCSRAGRDAQRGARGNPFAPAGSR
ncbi:uncharacterized protein LOC135181659 [Pogoniulus pusillus]|uniref:uncharacterized protein LOC135181659 n=1 Tax=Pogoniulus pusillus TaxID=488313 RepID=UPI0030B938D3